MVHPQTWCSLVWEMYDVYMYIFVHIHRNVYSGVNVNNTHVVDGLPNYRLCL